MINKLIIKMIGLLLSVSLFLPGLSFISFGISDKGLKAASHGGDIPDGLTVDDVVNMSLTMKVNSDYALVAGVKSPIFTSDDGVVYGRPYKNESGKVMVAVEPILDFFDTIHRFNSSGLGCDIFSGGKYRSIAVGRGYIDIEGDFIALNAVPAIQNTNGKEHLYIGLDDVEIIFNEIYVTYDESGMIFISVYNDFVDRSIDADEKIIKDIAKRFIFSEFDFRQIKNEAGQKLAADYRSSPIKDKRTFIDSFSDLSEFDQLYNLFVQGTNNFTHPFIKTNQARFDELHYTYLSTYDNEYSSYYDEELKWYIDTQIAYADNYLNKYAQLSMDGSYEGLLLGHWNYDSEGKANPGNGWQTDVIEGVTNHSVSIMPYQGPEYNYNAVTQKGYGQGYDPAGGRLNVLSDGESCLAAAFEPIALAYQITKDEKYLCFAYDWMVALCSWEHWGPGHYLNCANTAHRLATGYDWLYNDFVRVYGQTAVDQLAEKIYENAVYEATVTLTGNYDEHGRRGDSSRYWAHVGNWNSCGTLGMLIASLAVMDHDQYKSDCLFVIAASLGHYMERGMTYITLDGGYRESAGYWGTVRFMHMINQVLQNTAGTDFGLSNYPGLDTADYFGCMLEGSTYRKWNYHDDSEGGQPSFWYYLSADLYDNPEYAAIRYQQIHSGSSSKAPHRYDVLYYRKELVENMEEVSLPLDYSMTTIDATIVRDSWERNSLFAGLMGGYNNVAHGQFDSGNWIYENKGIRWFVDLGADNYNLYGGSFAKGYYKYSAEGNNTLALGSLPHGQLRDAKMNEDKIGGQLISYINNEFGSATVVDQKSVYGTAVDSAYRGMFTTNSRKTFIIQDEIKASSIQTFYWIAHFNNTTINSIDISEDGRTAVMVARNSKNEFVKLRVSLVSDNSNLSFEIMDTYTYLLSGTPSVDYSPTYKPGIKENNRSQFRRLVIKAENVIELNMAVVLEMIEDEPLELGYTLGWNGNQKALRPMSTWVPSADERVYEDSENDDNPVIPEPDNRPSLYEIIYSADKLAEIMENNPLGKDRAYFFENIAIIERSLNYYGREFDDELLNRCVQIYDEARNIYDAYYSYVDPITKNTKQIVNSLIKMKKKTS